MALPDASWWAAATGFAVAISATPGPNNAMVLASGANFGLRRGLPRPLGITFGLPAMPLAVAASGGAPGEDSLARLAALAVIFAAVTLPLLWLWAPAGFR